MGEVTMLDIASITNIFFIALTICRMIFFQDKYKSFKEDKILVVLGVLNLITALINVLAMQLYV